MNWYLDEHGKLVVREGWPERDYNRYRWFFMRSVEQYYYLDRPSTLEPFNYFEPQILRDFGIENGVRHYTGEQQGEICLLKMQHRLILPLVP